MSKSLNLFGGAAVGVGVMLVAAYNFADRNIADMPQNPPQLAPLSAVQLAELRAAEEAAQAPAVVAEAAPAGGLIAAANAQAGGAGAKFGLGRAALPEEVAAWDVNVMPDGRGLPAGSGDAMTGEPIFEENCAICHGSFAEGVDNWPKLAGGDGTLADKDPLKTVGSYWPYLSTVWDYVHRSMPFGNAQSLSADDVYAITAYILYSNDIIADDFVLSQETWAEVQMPNAEGFIIDDRAETEYAQWRAEPCMENCKPEAVQITMKATVLDVTPDDPTDDAAPAEEAAAEPAAEAEVQTAAAEPAAEAAAAPAEEAHAAIDPALVAEGENVFKKCKACHQVGDGAKNRTGPQLNGIFGRAIGGVDGFKYSGTMAGMGGEWTEETLAAFLADPRGYVKGTKMAFAGLKSDEEIAAVTAYLKSFQ
ncbi:c-type cytochrome [Thetidibacter halocola]|uniref:C-type cytochrome n=1 Tax=Thetidibacter halocola TaxID=2827239 RepID=A0A8J8B906_9RHOB|nr:c-type cytochrome [Thetidibacter halocola]MBS0125344.1 c-type cytochrome [Thetidibacter halocola]